MKKLFFVILAIGILLCGCGKENESIGIIGGADGPTSIFVETGK